LKQRTYYAIDRPQFEQIQAELRQRRFCTAGADTGIATASGVRMKYEYREAEGSLTLTIEQKPLLVRYDKVWKKIENYVRERLQAQSEPLLVGIVNS